MAAGFFDNFRRPIVWIALFAIPFGSCGIITRMIVLRLQQKAYSGLSLRLVKILGFVTSTGVFFGFVYFLYLTGYIVD